MQVEKGPLPVHRKVISAERNDCMVEEKAQNQTTLSREYVSGKVLDFVKTLFPKTPKIGPTSSLLSLLMLSPLETHGHAAVRCIAQRALRSTIHHSCIPKVGVDALKIGERCGQP